MINDSLTYRAKLEMLKEEIIIPAIYQPGFCFKFLFKVNALVGIGYK